MDKTLITNNKAHINYFEIDKYECGIVLKGNEVKSLFNSQANITDSYVLISHDEAYIVNMYIAPYEKHNTFYKILPTRRRKLLLNKSEIIKISHQIKKYHLTLIPTIAYVKNNKIKINVILAKHKKSHDKRNDIKNKQNDRYLSKVAKYIKQI
ncbi:MAG: SsrA-binding protein SmpB [Mycoplasmataceae bacterium]|jgi:SsrA-binding protein|nr:SsrA-binding protein SmpB [Mycoplasmataceae bacterium]